MSLLLMNIIAILRGLVYYKSYDGNSNKQQSYDVIEKMQLFFHLILLLFHETAVDAIN